MNHDDERDHSEEAANRAAYEAEYRAEVEEEQRSSQYGRELRDQGAEIVSENSLQDWRNAVDSAILDLAVSGVPFTVDDVREVVAREPHHPNAWGARFLFARREGLIAQVGWKQSTRPSRHASVCWVWQGQ